MENFTNVKLKLDYPCFWVYKIVINSNINAQSLIESIINNRKHSIEKSKISKKGKLISYNIKLLVYNDEDRKKLYSLFGQDDNIKIVL